MEESRGKKAREKGENLGDPAAKLLAKLPPNYMEMTDQEQEVWRHELARTILERFRQDRPRPCR